MDLSIHKNGANPDIKLQVANNPSQWWEQFEWKAPYLHNIKTGQVVEVLNGND
jgi:hypothetical protein